jgi:hypothetical protein
MDGDRGEGGWWPDEEKSAERTDRPKLPAEPDPDTRPPAGLASRRSNRSPSRYSMFVGLAFVVIIIVALLNLLGDDDAGILGVADDEGLPLAEFAVPSALGSSDADANVAQDDCLSSRNPCPDGDRRTPACEIETSGEAADAIRLCDLFGRPLAISFWFTRGGDCVPTQNAFDQVASRYKGKVNFLSVDIRDSRETVAGIVRDNGWDVPVGLDPDGAVSNLYRVGICPTLVLAYPGGILYRAEVAPGNYDAAQIDDLVADLLKASRARAATSR